MTVMGSFISLRGTVFGNHRTVYPFSILERALFFHSRAKEQDPGGDLNCIRNFTDSSQDGVNFLNKKC